jgi:hypothetical protein
MPKKRRNGKQKCGSKCMIKKKKKSQQPLEIVLPTK